MSFAILIVVGLLTGLTTVLFGFGGGFVTVPVVTWFDAGAGPDTARLAVATSAVVMVVNACVATAASDRRILALLRRNRVLIPLLGVGGALGALAARWTPGAVTQWGFIAYLAVTIVDLLVRPGFFHRQGSTRPGTDAAGGVRGALGLPIGAVAAFLGVGGSVMTVPLLRRSGHDMRTATTLANPFTLAIAAPALAVFLTDDARACVGANAGGTVLVYGSVDLGAAALLLAGALPVIIALRRRPPGISDAVHARSYSGLLLLALAAMLAATVSR